MEAAVNDEKRFTALDLEFHLSLAAASENFLILDLVSMVRSQLEKTISKVLLLPNARPLSLKEHAMIINAIKRHDPDAAAEAMRNHLELALKRYHSAVGHEHISIASSSRKSPGSRKTLKRGEAQA
jgi:GntR family transcriptional repressor for pyruvate dehydrogenase complex